YLVYILGWAMIDPKIAPKLAPSEYRVAVPESLLALERGPKRRIVPGLLTAGTLGATWWYVVVYNAPEVVVAAPAPAPLAPGAPVSKPAGPLVKEEQPQTLGSPASAEKEEPPQELGAAQESDASAPGRPGDAPVEEMTSVREVPTGPAASKVPANFYAWFWAIGALLALVLLFYFWRMDGEQLEILKQLLASVVPLGLLTVVVLAVILFGICTATES